MKNSMTKSQMKTHATGLRVTALLVLVSLALGACANSSRPQSTLNPHSPQAQQLNNLFIPVFWIAVVVFFIVSTLILIAVFRFRARSEDDRPRQVHGNARMEIAWTIAPALLLAIIAVPTVRMVFSINDIPKNTMQIDVTGHRWWWQFGYPAQGIETANEMHIPIKTNIVLNLTSVDGVHNFWPPQLNGKLYAIPGRHNQMVISADKAQTYMGQCAEYCGVSHANMHFLVVAQAESDFEAWLASQKQAPAPVTPDTFNAANVAAGQVLFRTMGCAGCHTITGISAGLVGPNLTHLRSRTVFAGASFEMTDNNLRKWLRNPPAMKPGSVMPNLHLSEDQITKLLAYLDSLK
jgi:cytochrome c oxidase subunit 2